MKENVGPSEDPVADDGSGAGVRRRIIIATVWAVVVRGLVWMFSFLVIGPVLGTLAFALLAESRFGVESPALVEALATLVALIAMITTAVAVHRDTPRWRRRAQVFGWALAGETVFYLGSIVVGLLALGGLSNLADAAWPTVVVAVVNTPLVLLGVSIARRAARTGSQPQPASSP